MLMFLKLVAFKIKFKLRLNLRFPKPWNLMLWLDFKLDLIFKLGLILGMSPKIWKGTSR
jgi:hypothetical protein